MNQMKNVLVAVALAACTAPAWAQGGAVDADALEATRDTLARWVQTQQIISKERRDWEVAREMLEQRAALVEGEIRAIEERLSELRSGLNEASAQRGELTGGNTELRQASAEFVDMVTSLENRTRTLLAGAPAPIRERVAPLSQRIPADPASTKQSLSERFQNVIGILNEVNKFNADITVTSEIQALPDGTTAEVQAIYIGLGQAYYVTPDGKSAGIGRPTPEGWRWTEANDLALRITRAIAILKNEEVPAYVPLPVEIR